MNVTKYISSNDERAYLEKIGYSFSPLDAAKIIEICDHIDLYEKQKAFLELIAETEDEAVTIPAKLICNEKNISLHTLLKSYIEEQNEAVAYFKRIEDDCVYVAERDDEPLPVVCKDFKKELFSFLQSDSMGKICFTKKNLSTGAETSVGYDKKGRLLWVHDLDRFVIPYNILLLDFRLSEDIPSPFETGDLVIACEKHKVAPFVITKIEEDCIYGYSMHNGRLINSCSYNTVAEIEFYRGNDTPALQAVSDFLKGKSELDIFINTYHKAALEEYGSLLC